MWLLIGSTVAYSYHRYGLSALGFLAVGFGGSAVVWSRWSERAGSHNSFAAFFQQPSGLTAPEIVLLVTHAPLVLVGVAILWRHVISRAD